MYNPLGSCFEGDFHIILLIWGSGSSCWMYKPLWCFDGLYNLANTFLGSSVHNDYKMRIFGV